MIIDKDYLLKVYGEEWGPDAGLWNTSVESKYLEFRLAEFFEENFTVPSGAQVCNVGIGAGYWDRYLSYRLQGGTLTSVDIDETCCRQLRERLINEKNPNRVDVVCSDVLALSGFEGAFDLVTLVGSTRRETGQWEALFRKLAGLLRAGGSLYYMELHEEQPAGRTAALFESCGLKTVKAVRDDRYGLCASYWKLERTENTRKEGTVCTTTGKN